MPCLNQPGCQKSEYRPKISKVHAKLDPTTPAADKAKCGVQAEQNEAEAKAKADLTAACAALNETVRCPGDCDCEGEGVFPAKWTVLNPAGVPLSWAKTETTALGCKWQIEIIYQLEYRETTPGKCYKKPPVSPEHF